MKIALIGEYTFKQWEGSATHKVQKYILRELSVSNEAALIEMIYTDSKLRKLWSRITIRHDVNGKIVSGGIINIFYFILDQKFEIIHFIVTRKWMSILSVVLKICSLKTITTFHDTLALRNKTKNCDYYLKKILLKTSSCIFVYNEIDENTIRMISSEKVMYKIRNGVDLQQYYPQMKKQFEREDIKCEWTITFAGGLGNKAKGLNFLKEALCEIPNCNLQICGENRMNLKNKDFIGSLDENDFAEQLRKSYMTIIPSEYESFSLTAIESMACGIPVIISDQSGAAFYLHNNVDCLKVTYGNIHELREKIKLLIRNKNIYEAIKNNALEVVKEFTWKNVASDYIRNYSGII